MIVTASIVDGFQIGVMPTPDGDMVVIVAHLANGTQVPLLCRPTVGLELSKFVSDKAKEILDGPQDSSQLPN